MTAQFTKISNARTPRPDSRRCRPVDGRPSARSAILTLLTVSAAHAAGSGMPWEAPLERILESVQGPVAKIVAVIVITVTGISLAFGDTSGGFRKMVQVVFGLSIAFAASSFFLSFFSFGGGALI